MKKINIKMLVVLATFIPAIAFAQNKDLKYIARLITDYLNIGLGLIIGLAVVTFVWNVYLYFFTEKDREGAATYVLYSVIGFFVILSFWGLVALLRNSIKLDDQAPDVLKDMRNTGGDTPLIPGVNTGYPTGGTSGTIKNP